MITIIKDENLTTKTKIYIKHKPSISLVLSILIYKYAIMENSNRNNSGNFYKCPYQTKVYGTEKCELIYRKSYQGDWGDWDELPQTSVKEENDNEQRENEGRAIPLSVLHAPLHN